MREVNCLQCRGVHAGRPFKYLDSARAQYAIPLAARVSQPQALFLRGRYLVPGYFPSVSESVCGCSNIPRSLTSFGSHPSIDR